LELLQLLLERLFAEKGMADAGCLKPDMEERRDVAARRMCIASNSLPLDPGSGPFRHGPSYTALEQRDQIDRCLSDTNAGRLGRMFGHQDSDNGGAQQSPSSGPAFSDMANSASRKRREPSKNGAPRPDRSGHGALHSPRKAGPHDGRDPHAMSEAVGYARKDLVALVLADIVVVAEIGVAIFEAGRDIVEELAFNSTADEPAVKIVLVADRDAADVPRHARPGVGIAAAHIEQIALAEDVAGAGRGIERIAGVQRRIVGAVWPNPIALAQGEASFDAEHDVGRHLMIIADEDTAHDGILLVAEGLVVGPPDLGAGIGALEFLGEGRGR